MDSTAPFQLLLFHRDIAFCRASVAAGVDGLIIDLENKEKAELQSGFDTEINSETLADIEAAKTLTDTHVLCKNSRPDASECAPLHVQRYRNSVWLLAPPIASR